ncbi:NPCBM/NEW2 domain-containing protein [Bacillus cereus]|uniref:NPCBM/NEW2 domain-containing protein n=1 Tax=Bacillus cereus TaxID=1396 RepID=UPI00119F91D4|nr:NPCBM/NEW2 domain-containing protein [Bacillus cereus]
MKKIGIAVMSLSLALGAGCAKEETVSKEEKVKNSEEQVEVSKTGNSKKEAEKELNIVEEASVNKRNEVLFENNKGKATLIGETITPEGTIVAAIQLDGELKNATLPDIKLKFVTDSGKSEELSKADFSGYRFVKDSIIVVYESLSKVDGTKLMRMDYSFKKNENNDNPVDVKSLTFKEATGTIKIPALKMITNNSADKLNIKGENDDFKLTIDKIYVDSTKSEELKISGKIESKKDMTFDDGKLHYTRPFIHKYGTPSISMKQSELFAGIPVDFTMTLESKIPFAKDKSSIFNFDFDGILFSFDAAKGKKYSGPINLDDLPIIDNESYLDDLGLDGFTAVNGEKYYNGIQSDRTFWNHGIGDTSERATYEYTLGKEFKTLKFKLGAGEKFKGQGGNYEVFIYGDDFNSEGEGNPTGTPLLHEQVTSDSPMKDVTVDVSGVKQLHVYYHSTSIEKEKGFLFESETEKGKVQLLMTDMKLQ